MRIKSTGLFSLFLCMTSMLQAQQRPQYTQYIFNEFLINPAVAGVGGMLTLSLAAAANGMAWREHPRQPTYPHIYP